jgi:hypothetical protein
MVIMNSDVTILRPITRRFFIFFRTLHLSNNGFENAYFPFAFIQHGSQKKLFLGRKNMGEAFAFPLPPPVADHRLRL